MFLHGFQLDELAQEKVSFFTLRMPSPDGMILDDRDRLYFGNLENYAILYLEPDRETIRGCCGTGQIVRARAC